MPVTDDEKDKLAQAAYELWLFRTDEILKARNRVLDKEVPFTREALDKQAEDEREAWRKYKQDMREATRALNQRLAELGIPSKYFRSEDY